MNVAFAVVLAVLAAALLELLKDELRGQIERVPYALLVLARLRVPPELRASLHDDEWLPELHHILADAERLPITTLVRGTRYSLGLLRSASAIAAELAPVRAAASPEQPRAVRLKMLIGVLAAAVSFVSGFGVFGALAGAIISLTGGFVVVAVVFTISRDLRELWQERERTPWA